MLLNDVKHTVLKYDEDHDRSELKYYSDLISPQSRIVTSCLVLPD